MSTPSFIDRLRSRSRRPEHVSLLGAVPPLLVETSPGPLPEVPALPDDHWHAGDPRLAPGATSLSAVDVPSPRRPVDRRGLHVVPEAVPQVDLRGGVVDLRAAEEDPAEGGAAGGAGPATAPAPAALPAPRASHPAPEREAPCAETSTWLG